MGYGRSALDPVTETEIVVNVRELASRSGITMLAISHRPAWTTVADKIVRMQNEGITEVTPNVARSASG